MSLRGATDLVATWQSAGKHPYLQGRFREIPTSHDLTSTSKDDFNTKLTSTTKLVSVIAPRDDVFI